uniref:Antirestriction protein-like protein n=2 Tax=Caulobacter TaxID=75 RepID=B0T9R7_CAUSK
MPNRRMADARKTSLRQTPCGIIRIAALWDLCRYRHKSHWSGADHRLGRTFGQRFGDAAYAFEELVAEIGSAAIGLRIGLRPQILDSHAAYLGHWVKILKDRPGALLEASGHAQRAVDHLLAYSQPAQASQPLAA